MTVDLIYVAQPYIRQGGALLPGVAQCSTSGFQAEEMGRGMAACAAGVAVYAMECSPEYEIWGEPEIMALYGDVPAELAVTRGA